VQLVDAVKRTHIYLAKDDMQRLVVGRGDTDRPAVIRSQQISKLELSLASSKAAVLSVSDEAHKAYEDQDESCTQEVTYSHIGHT
jgi:hexosaminidase